MKGRTQFHWDYRLSAEIKLRAERSAGEMLAGMEKQHGARPTTGFHDVRPLSDLGISKLQSQRWQAVAATKAVGVYNSHGHEVTVEIPNK